MPDIAALGIKIGGIDGIKSATVALDKLKTSGQSAESVAKALGVSSAELARVVDRVGTSGRNAATALDLQRIKSEAVANAQKEVVTATDKAASAAVAQGDALKKMSTQMDGAIRMARGLAGVLLGVFSGQAIRGSIDYADAIGITATQLNVTTDALQEYRYAASQVGLQNSDVDRAISRLNMTITQQADRLASIGVAARDANGNLRSSTDVLADVAEAFVAAQNPTEKARVALEAFGRSGQQLSPLLAEGRAGIEAYSARAHELGLVLSGEVVTGAGEVNIALAQQKAALSGELAQLVIEHKDAIMKLSQAFAGLLEQMVKIGAWAANNPVIAGALLGGIGGASVGGPIGAAVGGLGGAVTGLGAKAGWFDGKQMPAVGIGVLKPGRTAVSGGLGSGSAAPLPVVITGDTSGGAHGGGASSPARAGERQLTPAEVRDMNVAGEGILNITREFSGVLADIAAVPLQVRDFTQELRGSQFLNMMESASRFADQMSQNLSQAIVYGQNLGTALVNSFKAAAAEALSNGLFDLLLGKDRRSGIIGSLIGAVLGGSGVAGARADGGPVTGGRAYLVGERGPEIFVPGQSGGIIPNHNLSVSVDARGGDASAIAAAVVPAMEQLLRRANAYTDRSMMMMRTPRLATSMGA